ncbi:uncharacterized protein LOC126787122 [Argentina anserina]|uniref:uncharacterized protein LOC126787122 n=1 Tax=Argentina anserina TaxID=57926 RepID=UPI002176864E|nr:uncharacterized protein LOC126787122 [Potentilla anserina]
MIEEKEDMAMVSLTRGDPFHRKAYFLKPSVPDSSIDYQLEFKLPQCFSSLPSPFNPKELPLELQFRAWRLEHKDLQTWVDHLAPLHQSTWKKAGIYEAIYNSTYRIRKQTDLVFALAEKWCTETNTFIFPWGEATITLEDVMILGGFSVSGDSIFSPLEDMEEKQMQCELEEERKGLYDYSAGKKTADTFVWLKRFMNSGKELEHVAFLVFWLSRYVFHNARNIVNKAVFSIAIRLATGNRIALAPAVRASIYRDLSLLKKNVVASTG